MIENLQQVFRFRSLVQALVVRQLASRYRGSALGFVWTLLNPLCLMLVYTLVFKFYIRFSAVEHYSLFLFCGLLPWIALTSALGEGTGSIVASGHLITKSMFPAQVLPVVSCVGALLNFVLSLPVLLTFIVIGIGSIPVTIALLPVVLLIQLVMTLGITLGLAALNVRYRDVQHLLGNVLTFLFFLCPIVYSVDTVPAEFQWTMILNPFALLTNVYHKILLDGVVPDLMQLVYLTAVSFIFLVVGNWIFNAQRESFAELL